MPVGHGLVEEQLACFLASSNPTKAHPRLHRQQEHGRLSVVWRLSWGLETCLKNHAGCDFDTCAPSLTLNVLMQFSIASPALFLTLFGGSKYFSNSGCGGGNGLLVMSET